LIAAFALAGTLYGVSALVDSVTSTPDSTGRDSSRRDCSAPVAVPGKLPETLMVDAQAQAFATDLLARHPSVLTVAVGLDMRTARPLFVVSREGDNPPSANLALATQPRYPMASLAKILTSAAALSSGMDPFQNINFRGQAHTLYKSQIRHAEGSTEVSLAKAFALSINPVFGILGANTLGRQAILDWADSLGFNRPDGLGNGVQAGRMSAPADTFNLAEVSSGFVRTTFLSPVHAAMIVRKFGHDGVLRPPAWIPPVVDSTCDESTVPRQAPYTGLTELFRLTVDSGTARGGFRTGWPVESREGFLLGGKTGSLDGTDPPGRYEWFAGYARVEGEIDSGIAIAVMTVSKDRHVLNASWTAASLLHWWARHSGELGAAPVDAASKADLDSARARYTVNDKDALLERAWHRPWVRKRRVRKH
jgi:cell division protein FtsI/penicillin-binding protein 2